MSAGKHARFVSPGVARSVSLWSCFVVFYQRSWRLKPKQAGLLSAATYKTRAVEFEVTVEANIQNDTHTEDDRKVFKSNFDVTFEVRVLCRKIEECIAGQCGIRSIMVVTTLCIFWGG